MRENFPVTQNEFDYPAHETLVSTTDLQGQITYCNPGFVRVSGYEHNELMGAPHNIVRHPDMPAEAFRDLWRTCGHGLPWTGLVKNRRKNGDYYWVVANVTPIMDGSKPVGYMSVRTKPSRAQIAGAEALYAQMSVEAQSQQIRTHLAGGFVKPSGFKGLVQRAFSFSLRIQIAVAAGVTLALAIGAARLLAQGGMGIFVLALLWAAGVFTITGLLSARVITPLDDAVKVANRMAAGDLTGRPHVERSDTVGALFRALSQLNVNLQAIVGDVRREVDGLTQTAREVAAGNQDLSNRTEAQAANLEQTAASMEQLTTAVQQNHHTSTQANDVVSRTRTVATQGGDEVSAVMNTMSDIQTSARRIGDIIGVIDGIAFQTNILALNAAVEAARAGEQGRGFAVVASEVRALARRTTDAAREVKTLVGDSVNKADAGSAAVQAAGQTIGEVVQSVQSVAQMMQKISSASHTQSTGISQVNQAVTQLDSVTQQNAALVEQSAATAQTLSNQAQALAGAVRIFKVEMA